MFAFIWTLAISLLKVLGVVASAYIFYHRVWQYMKAVRFYRGQGEDVCKIAEGHAPLIGNFYLMLWSAYKSWKEGDNYFVMTHAYDFASRNTGTAVMFITNEAGLLIRDVKVVEAMYTTKNKYFDKHPLVKDLSMCMTGESILFAETTEDWRKSRKAMSPAFYKGKLEHLIEISRQAVRTTVARFKDISSTGARAEVDIMKEIGLMHSRILLTCALGVDCSEAPVDFWENGACRKTTLADSLRTTFTNLVNRLTSAHVVFFPFLAAWYLTPYERDQARNAKALRDFCAAIIDSRREEIK